MMKISAMTTDTTSVKSILQNYTAYSTIPTAFNAAASNKQQTLTLLDVMIKKIPILHVIIIKPTVTKKKNLRTELIFSHLFLLAYIKNIRNI